MKYETYLLANSVFLSIANGIPSHAHYLGHIKHKPQLLMKQSNETSMHNECSRSIALSRALLDLVLDSIHLSHFSA